MLLVAILIAAGCGLRQPTAARTLDGAAEPTRAVPAQVGAQMVERLSRIHAERRSGGGDYVLGPGDVISVRAFDLDQLNQRVRVDGDGTVTLPLLNAVPVGGRTVAQTQHDLTGRLRAFMYDPSVTIFVEEYRSVQVAVVGAVQRPGLVAMTTRDATVFDALSAAGGTTAEAGSRIYLLPVESMPHQGDAAVVPAIATDDPAALDAAVAAAPEDAPIVVDTAQVAHQAQRLLFTLPVRAGDVVLVPSRGQVVVAGWVEKPGTYPLYSGMTLRGALGAAGGPSFPARTNRIRVHRPDAIGITQTRDVDYSAIEAGQASDVLLYEGDVVEVGAATTKLVPYAFYKVFTDLFRVGAGIRMTP